MVFFHFIRASVCHHPKNARSWKYFRHISFLYIYMKCECHPHKNIKILSRPWIERPHWNSFIIHREHCVVAHTHTISVIDALQMYYRVSKAKKKKSHVKYTKELKFILYIREWCFWNLFFFMRILLQNICEKNARCACNDFYVKSVRIKNKHVTLSIYINNNNRAQSNDEIWKRARVYLCIMTWQQQQH